MSIRSFSDDRIRLICFGHDQEACAPASRLMKDAKDNYTAVLNSDGAFLQDKLKFYLNECCQIEEKAVDVNHPVKKAFIKRLYHQSWKIL